MRRALVLVVALVLLAAAGPPAAQADGDPASDVLLLQDAYLPYAPQVSPKLQRVLTTLLKQTKAKGFALKVAVIGSQQDLGSVPQLFGKPQNYALFLEREIAFNSKKALLVVMPAGYGVTEATPATAAALKGLAPPNSTNSDDLARAAVAATVRLAKAAGHPVPAPAVPGGNGSGGGSASPLLIAGVPVLLLILGGVLATLKRREAERDEAPT